MAYLRFKPSYTDLQTLPDSLESFALLSFEPKALPYSLALPQAKVLGKPSRWFEATPKGHRICRANRDNPDLLRKPFFRLGKAKLRYVGERGDRLWRRHEPQVSHQLRFSLV